MSKSLKSALQMTALLAYMGLLLSIVFSENSRLELACCAVTTMCSCMLFFSKKSPTD